MPAPRVNHRRRTREGNERRSLQRGLRRPTVKQGFLKRR